MLLKKSAVLVSAVATAGATLLVVSPSASADPDVAGTYNTVTPVRVVDTRNGTGGPAQTLAAGQTLTTKVTGPLPAAATPSAVALAVTVVDPSTSGFLSAYAGGTTRPNVSNINFVAHASTPNTVVVKPSDTGTVSFYNGSGGSISVLADVYGYWTGGTVDTSTGGAYSAVTPTRIRDSRTDDNSPIPAGGQASVPVTGQAGIPAGASAIVANVTAIGPSAAGFLTADSVAAGSDTSSLNFAARQTRANLLVVPINDDGTISLRNGSRAALNYAVDVFGYIGEGTPSNDGAYVASSPYRAADTRTSKPVPALGTLKVSLFPNQDSIFKAVTVNVTATQFTTGGYLTPWSGSGARPITSVSNYNGSVPRATTVVVPLNADGSISIYNGSRGTVQVIVDVEGFVLNGDVQAMPNAKAQQRVNTSLGQARAYSAKHVSK